MNVYERLMAVALASTLALVSTAALAAKSGRINDLSGAVSIVSNNGDERNARAGSKLRVGDTVQTGNESHAVLKFADDHLIVLQSNTAFLIEDYKFAKKHSSASRIIFSLLKGGLRSITGHIAKYHRSAFKLKVAWLTLGVRGTDFAVVRPRSATVDLYTRVYAGMISVATDAGTEVFQAGETVFIRAAAGRLVVASVDRPARIFSEIERLSAARVRGVRQRHGEP
jgi:hypothetical protein